MTAGQRISLMLMKRATGERIVIKIVRNGNLTSLYPLLVTELSVRNFALELNRLEIVENWSSFFVLLYKVVALAF